MSPSSNDRNTIAKLSVLVPVYNERWTLREIISRVLAAPVPMEIEIVAVDDGSTDGSWELLQDLAQDDHRIRAFRQPENRGKGSAIRTAINHMTGDVAVIQDADLEYDPREFSLLLEPILSNKADAVFGSRFTSHSRRVLFFWHSVVNHCLTLISNMITDLNLTDMETCYKMVRADILRQLRLRSDTFTIEPELTCRLAQWGARIYEVPISYSGRTYVEGKKIRWFDGVKALWELFRCSVLDRQFTDHSGFYTLTSVARASNYTRWILEQVTPYLGKRVLEAGSGIGNVSSLLLNRERLVLVDNEAMYVTTLMQRYGTRCNIRVDCADLTNPSHFHRWHAEEIDTVFCSNVLEHLGPDESVLRSFFETLTPGGHCVIVVPAEPRLYSPIDAELGHFRRYSRDELAGKMRDAGFEIQATRQFNKVGSISWALSGLVMRRRHLSPWQMKWFDRILPIVKLFEWILPLPGMSLIMVGRKPAHAAARRAA